jgi:predicted LPLAT superfamily acyltransferase
MMMSAWSERRERGSATLTQLMIWLALRAGWPVSQALLYPITAYFFLSSPGARRASRRFLGRVLQRPVTVREQFRHLFTFSCVLLDRVFLLSNRLQHFRIDVAGLEHVTTALAQGRGCVLLGSHLGSFEVLRAFGREAPVPVRVLMYRANRGAYSRLVEQLDPTLPDAIIEIGTPEAMLLVRESLARGELVGILADRTPAGQKMVTVPFLGDVAAFPAGPLVLCASLGAPVVLFFGIHAGLRCYLIQFESFADRIVAERANRSEHIAGWVRHYVERLEAFCRAYPFNWFNFYEFWDTAPETPSRSVAGAAAPSAIQGGGRTVAADIRGHR